MAKSQKVYLVTEGEYSDYTVKAVFATLQAAEAFIEVDGGEVDERTLYDGVPPRGRWYSVERYRRGTSEPFGDVERKAIDNWEFDGPPWTGYKRSAANYTRWEYGERAFGQDEAAVEKMWTEQHMAEEARDAGA